MEPKDIILQAKQEHLLLVRMEALFVEHGDFQGIELHSGEESTLQTELDFALLLAERALEDLWERLPAGDADQAVQTFWKRFQDLVNREVETGKKMHLEAEEKEKEF